MDESTAPAHSAMSNLHTINDRASHDAAVATAEGTRPAHDDAIPTIIYVSSASIPACRTAYPKLLNLAAAHPHVQVHVMELTADTTPMIKFGPQNCPIFILMKGDYCETILGPDFARLETATQENLKKGESQ